MKMTISGGGNGAHTLAGVMSMNAYLDIAVFNLYQDEAERWTDSMNKHGFCVNFGNEEKLTQNPGSVRFTVTKDVSVVEKSDFVLICLPAYAHEVYLKVIVPHLSDACTVVCLPGQPGFEYQCLFYLRKHNKTCNIMSLETLPWATRIVDYGKEVLVSGTKEHVGISFVQRNAIPASEAIASFQNALGKRPLLHRLHVLALTLATKASMHPPIMYSKWKDWDGTPLDSQPLFYQGVDKKAAETLDVVTREINAIAGAVKRAFPHLDFSCLTSMKGWLTEHYGDQIGDNSTLMTALQTNKAYNELKHPVIKTDVGKYMPDFQYRYLSEDIPFGLVVHKAIADMVNVKTPVMDSIIEWAQTKLGRVYMVDGKLSTVDADSTRLPQDYGIDSIETLVKMFE